VLRLTLVCFVLCCPPAAARAVAPSFTVSPSSVAPGKPVTFGFRANGGPRARAGGHPRLRTAPVRAKLGSCARGAGISVAGRRRRGAARAHAARL
jgi:hypothetical protein